MVKVKYVLLFPLNYNDGTTVPEKLLNQFLDELFVLAGGHRIAGKGPGAYRMKDGTKQVDESLEIWAAVNEEDVSALKRLVAAYAGILGQESMYLERTGGTVEFIPPLEEGGTTQ